MARERMVTRTIMSTTAKVLCMDLTTAVAVEKMFTVSTTYVTKEATLKALQKKYDTPDLKLVAIMDLIENEQLFGMKEEVFMKYAVLLDPETRKRITE